MALVDRSQPPNQRYASVTDLRIWQTSPEVQVDPPYQAVTQGNRILGFELVKLPAGQADPWSVHVWQGEHLVVAPSGPMPWDVIEARSSAMKLAAESPSKEWGIQEAPAGLKQLVIRSLEPVLQRSLSGTSFKFVIAPEVEVQFRRGEERASAPVMTKATTPDPGIPWTPPQVVKGESALIAPKVAYRGPGSWSEQLDAATRLLDRIKEAVRSAESVEAGARKNLVEALLASHPQLQPLRTLANGRTFAEQSDRLRLGPLLTEAARGSFDKEAAQALVQHPDTTYSLGPVKLFVGVKVQGATQQWSSLWVQLN
jgi:hypothetical protein